MLPLVDRTALKGGLDLVGQLPDSLAISDFLSALGNGSSRPASPSGEAIEADGSVKDDCTQYGVFNQPVAAGIHGNTALPKSPGPQHTPLLPVPFFWVRKSA